MQQVRSKNQIACPSFVVLILNCNFVKNVLKKRCAGYVKARKELSIHEAPNILTIVLKRFQVSITYR